MGQQATLVDQATLPSNKSGFVRCLHLQDILGYENTIDIRLRLSNSRGQRYCLTDGHASRTTFERGADIGVCWCLWRYLE